MEVLLLIVYYDNKVCPRLAASDVSVGIRHPMSTCPPFFPHDREPTVATMSQTDLQLRLSHGKGEGDDWTKIEDKARRKTIQNRLAQRKRRAFLLSGTMPALCSNVKQNRHQAIERQASKGFRASCSASGRATPMSWQSARVSYYFIHGLDISTSM